MFGIAISIVASSYQYVNAQTTDGSKEVRKFSCVLIQKGKNLDSLKNVALKYSDFYVWIEKSNEGYFVKAKLKPKEINRFSSLYGNPNYISCDTDVSRWVMKTEVISLKDIGFSEDITVEGTSPYFEFFFPRYDTFAGGKAVFNLTISPLVKEDESNIALKINKTPVKLFKLKDVGYAPKIEFSIPNQKNKTAIRLSLEGNLKSGKNICDDINTRNIYMKIDVKNSKFYVLRDLRKRNIKNFFFDYAKNYYVSKLDNDSLKLFYYIPSTVKWFKTDVKTIGNVNLNGSEGKIIHSTSNGKVYVGSNNNQLFLGNPDIISENSIKSLLVKEVSNSNLNERKTSFEDRILPFSYFGYKTTTTSGVGVLTFLIPIYTSDLGGLPDNLKMKLYISHSAIDKHDRASLEVYFNNALIYSHRLKEAVVERKGYLVEVPKDIIQAGLNKVEVKVNYYPSSDKCVGAVPKINLTLFDDSYIYWNSEIKDASSIRDFINLVNGNVAVIVEDENFKQPASQFLKVLGQTNPNINRIDVYTSTKGLNTDNYDYVIMFLDHKTAKSLLHSTDAPLKLDKAGFSVYNPANKKVLFNFEPKNDLGFIEVLEYKGKPSLVVSYIGDKSVLNGLNRLNYVNINNLLGNVALFNRDEFSSFEIGRKLKVEYISEKGLEYYWDNYKVFAITVLAILVILFEIFLFRKLVRTKRENKQ